MALRNLALAALLAGLAAHLAGSLSVSMLAWLAVASGLAITAGWLHGVAGALLGCLDVALAHGPSPTTFSLLLLAALYPGALADGLRRRVRELRETVALQAEQLVRRREREQVLEQANADLKVSIVERGSGLADLYEIFRRLAEPDEGAILDVVRDFVKAEQCSLYRLEGKRLRLAGQRGWPAVTEESFELGQDLLSQAVLDKELRTLRDFPLERLDGLPADLLLRLMAAPILHPGTGQCLGVISVESLPFHHFTRPTAQLLQTVAELAGRALAAEAPPPVHDWLSPEHFVRRLRGDLEAVGQGTRSPFCLIWLSSANWDRLAVSVRHLAERALSLIAGAHLRPSDARGHVEEGIMAVILEGTAAEQGQSLVAALTRDLEDYLVKWLPELQGTVIDVGLVSCEAAPDAQELLRRARGGARPCPL